MSTHDDLKRRAQKICEMLDDIAEMQEDLKLEKKGAESAGYDLKALMQVVKELRKPDMHEAQLELELVLDAYREGVGLKTRSTLDLKQHVEALAALGDVSISAGGDVVEIKSRRGKRSEEPVIGA